MIKKNLNNLFLFNGMKLAKLIYALVVTVALVRFLGPADYGLYSYILIITSFISIVSTFGMRSIIVKLAVGGEYSVTSLLNHSILIYIILFTISYLVLILSIIITKQSFEISVYFLIVGFANFFLMYEIFVTYFEIEKKYKIYTNIKILSMIFSSIIIFGLIIFHSPIIFVFSAYLAEALLMFLLVLRYLPKGTFHFKMEQINKKILKNLIKMSAPLMFSSVAVLIYMKIDQIMLFNILGSEATGLYTVGVRIIEQAYVIPLSLSVVLFPDLLNTEKLDDEVTNKEFQKLLQLVIVFSLICILTIYFFGQLGLRYLFGETYLIIFPALLILSVNVLPVGFGLICTKWFIMNGLQGRLLFFTVVGCVVNVVLNSILISALGVTGAALASLIAQLFTAIIINAFFMNTRRLFRIQMRSFSVRRWKINVL